MGFSSWNCLGCDKPIMNPFNLPGSRLWENDVVAIAHTGFTLRGSYGGYSDIDGVRIPIDWEANKAADDAWVEGDEPVIAGLPAMWHRLCFDGAEEADRERYRPSVWARNQGYVKEL
jgi:hypothetical protein